MANHRRKRTTRRELKRNSRKKLRGAEREAMNGHAPDTVALEWSHGKMNRDTPIINEEPRHRKVTNKRSPKKEKCPSNRTHEWLREWVESEDFFHREIKGPCDRCFVEHARWKQRQERYLRAGLTDWMTDRSGYERSMNGWCRLHGEKVFYTVRRKYATCIHCGKAKLEDTDSDAWMARWGGEYQKRLTLPRRTVKLY